MSDRCLREVMRLQHPTLQEPSRRVVAAYLADRARDPGLECYPSVGALMDYTGLGERQVRKILGDLARIGLVEPTGRFHKRVPVRRLTPGRVVGTVAHLDDTPDQDRPLHSSAPDPLHSSAPVNDPPLHSSAPDPLHSSAPGKGSGEKDLEVISPYGRDHPVSESTASLPPGDLPSAGPAEEPSLSDSELTAIVWATATADEAPLRAPEVARRLTAAGVRNPRSAGGGWSSDAVLRRLTGGPVAEQAARIWDWWVRFRAHHQLAAEGDQPAALRLAGFRISDAVKAAKPSSAAEVREAAEAAALRIKEALEGQVKLRGGGSMADTCRSPANLSRAHEAARARPVPQRRQAKAGGLLGEVVAQAESGGWGT